MHPRAGQAPAAVPGSAVTMQFPSITQPTTTLQVLGIPAECFPSPIHLSFSASDGAAIRGRGRSRHPRASYAGIVEGRPDLTSSGRVPPSMRQTNNTGEMLGAAAALRASCQADSSASTAHVLFTDSTYVIGAALRAVEGWNIRPPLEHTAPPPYGPWRVSGHNLPPLGRPDRHPALLHQLGRTMQGHIIILAHVASHTGRDDHASRLNDQADYQAGLHLHGGGTNAAASAKAVPPRTPSRTVGSSLFPLPRAPLHRGPTRFSPSEDFIPPSPPSPPPFPSSPALPPSLLPVLLFLLSLFSFCFFIFVYFSYLST